MTTVAVSAPSAPSRENWVLGGVASELSARLRAPAWFVRMVLLLAAFAAFWPVMAVYASVALVLPHSGRRPGWVNLIALGRIALVNIVGFGMGNLDLTGRGGLFSEGPWVWVPVGGVIVLAWTAMLQGGRRPAVADPAVDRRTVLSVLPAVAVLGATALTVLLFPSVRADRVLDAGLIAAGVAVVVLGPRLNLMSAAIALMLAGLMAIVLALSGTSLQGGFGSLDAAPARTGALAPAYRRAAGEVTLDAGRLTGTIRTTVSVGFGTVRVVLPAQASGTVAISVGHGAFNGLGPGVPRSGVGLHAVQRLTGRGARMRITISVGQGCVLLDERDYGGATSC
jgi:phage shock protein PspC (stress-responsive transcriptional regulator)